MIACYSIGAFGGIKILDIEYGIEDYVIWSWSDEEKKHKTKVCTTTGERNFFWVGKFRVYLDECLRV